VSAAPARPAVVRLYEHLFTRPDPGADGDLLADLNPRSEEVVTGAQVEPALGDVAAGDRVQFERLGYFAVDPESTSDRPVFNRTVTLRDTWAKVQARG
jgi:glutaminyl-tRNA synthetase